MRKLLLFLLGVVVGGAGMALAPRWLGGWSPAMLAGGAAEGTVEAKRWDGADLLLTLVTEEGATLATFRERAAAVDLLVEKGDSVQLGVARYSPFVEDPPVRRVVKKTQLEAAASAAALPPADADDASGLPEPGGAAAAPGSGSRRGRFAEGDNGGGTLPELPSAERDVGGATGTSGEPPGGEPASGEAAPPEPPPTTPQEGGEAAPRGVPAERATA